MSIVTIHHRIKTWHQHLVTQPTPKKGEESHPTLDKKLTLSFVDTEGIVLYYHIYKGITPNLK